MVVHPLRVLQPRVYNMSSAILLAKMLVLLMNVMRVEDLQKQSLRCNWVCNVTKSE